jgi:phage terminase Nu1 subunit (DNA packaging protein)
MTKTEVATACKVRCATVVNWVIAGCPHKKLKNGSYQFDLAKVQAWRKATKIPTRTTLNATGDELTYLAARARKEAALAKLRERQLDELEKRLCRVEEVFAELYVLGHNLKAGLQDLPARNAALVACEHNQQQCFAILTKDIQRVLEDFQHGQAAICDKFGLAGSPATSPR